LLSLSIVTRCGTPGSANRIQELLYSNVAA